MVKFCMISLVLMALLAICDSETIILGNYTYCSKRAHIKIKCTDAKIVPGTKVEWMKWDTIGQVREEVVSRSNEAELPVKIGRKFNCHYFAGRNRYWQEFRWNCTSAEEGTNSRDRPITEAPEKTTTEPTNIDKTTTTKEPSHNDEKTTTTGNGKQSSTDKEAEMTTQNSNSTQDGHSAVIRNSLSTAAVFGILVVIVQLK